MAKVGRPPMLTKAVYDKLPELIRAGSSDSKLAKIFGVSQSAISRWKERHQEFVIAYNIEKEKLYGLIEDSAAMAAIGFTQVVNDKEQYYPPNINAAKFVLPNVRPEKWKVEQSVMPVGHNVIVNFNFPRPELSPKVIDGTIIPAARK